MNTFFSNSSYSRNVYSASGVKLKTEHYTSLAAAEGGYGIAGLENIEYHGPVIYRNGKIDMVQFPGGYATIDGSDVTFHYYTQDYLGNNRAVINGTTGAIEQTTAYYPYGAVIADLGTGNSGQPFKFIGKELISANGLNVYDFGARLHYPAIPQFDRVDPLCEQYRGLSPYLYCANNPVNSIDPLGMYIVDENVREWESNKKSIEDKRNKLLSDISNTIKKGAKKGWDSETLSKKLGDKQMRVASLSKTLDTMSELENSSQGYSLSRATEGIGSVSLKGDIIDINYSDKANFVHEVTHAGQFESGDIAFSFSKEGAPMLVDIEDEAFAYMSQYAYNPSSISGLNPHISVNSIYNINCTWVYGIIYNGKNIYSMGSDSNTASSSIRVNSKLSQLPIAYPTNLSLKQFVGVNNLFVSDFLNFYYKK